MSWSHNLRGFVSAIVAVVLAALGLPGPHPGPPLPVASAPLPGTTVVKRDGAEVALRRVGRPHTASIAAQARRAGAQTQVTTTPTPATASSVPRGSRRDVDGDGLDEIVIGAFTPAGYGLIVDYSSLPFRDYLTAPVSSPTRPNFGDVLTSGDFNGDGFADLAVSNQGEFVPGGTTSESAFAGAVWIFYGGPTGLDAGTVQHINQNVEGVPDDMEGRDFFGASVAAGDINRDGYDEVAIGAPGESIGTIGPSAGTVTVLYGSPTGITTAGAFALSQDSPGVPDDAEPNEAFGQGVAIGDFTGDGFGDLAVGTPGEGVAPDCLGCVLGMVMLLPGDGAGLSSTGSTVLPGATDAVPVSTFGEYLLMADINQDGRDDLIAAMNRSGGGALIFAPGAAIGLSPAGVQLISEDMPGVPSERQCCQTGTFGEAFGFAVATGDVTGDGYLDLLVSDIGQDVDGIDNAGSAFLIPGTATGFTGTGSAMIMQGTPSPQPIGVKPPPGRQFREVAEAEDYFGYSVSIVNLDGVGPAELLIATDREVNPGEPSNLGSGFLMALHYQIVPPRRGAPASPVGLLVPFLSWSGRAFVAPDTVFSMGSSQLHS